MSIASYGLIGYPLTHSFSPQYFEQKFKALQLDAKYNLYSINKISSIVQVLDSEPGLLGLNVTTPYKETIIPYLDKLDEAAQHIGAVNCIHILKNKLIGYNTDIIGFEKSLTPLLRKNHTKALILGTGGASKAIAYVLSKLQIDYKLVSRQNSNKYLVYNEIDKDIVDKHTLIINTTPIGMYPHVEEQPSLPYKYITKKHLLYDLIYNPKETSFLTLGKKHGASIINGLEMLELQAEASWDIWNS